MNMLAELIIQRLHERGQFGPLEHYSRCLRSAFGAHPPPYSQAWYGKRFREHAHDPQWLANCLVDNAATEGWGAGKLWELAGRASVNEDIAGMIRSHAADEARHSHMYSGMVNLVFRGSVSPDVRETMNKFSPDLKTLEQTTLPAFSEQELVDNLLQMNVAEIRTLVNQMLTRPVAQTFCMESSREHVGKLLDTLMSDEVSHVGYTAKLMDDALAGKHGEFVWDIVNTRLMQFNELTLAEVGRPPSEAGGMSA
jgi:hypothetical protein